MWIGLYQPSAALLDLHGLAGLKGWQWLFVLQALPTIVLGFVFWLALPNGPADAPWLPPAEKQWLVSTLANERDIREQIQRFDVKSALTSRIVWLGGLAGAGIDCASHMEAGWGIKAGEAIVALGAIKAGESMQAGDEIEAGAGYGVYAGLQVHAEAWESSGRVHARLRPARLLSGWWAGA